MGNVDAKDVDVPALWKSEAKLSIKQRRARYRCGTNFTSADQLKSWNNDVNKSIESTTTRKFQEARETEKDKRKELLRAERRKKKQEAKNTNTTETKSEENKEENKEEKKEEIKEEKKEPEEKKSALNEEEIQRKQRKEERRVKELEMIRKEREEEDIPLTKYDGSDEINKKVCLIRGDITTLELDAIINAANKSLLGGGGIDGAIHKAAGDMLYNECAKLHGCDTGHSKITRGHNLPASFVIHTVGPVGRDQKALTSCYKTCMELTLQNEIKTIALCGISTGIYGYPLYAATHVALNTLREWLNDEQNRSKVDLIVFCTYLPKELVCYEKLMPLYFPPPDQSTDAVLKTYKEGYDKFDASKESEVVDQEVTKEELERKEKKRKDKEERTKRDQELRERFGKVKISESGEKSVKPSDMENK